MGYCDISDISGYVEYSRKGSLNALILDDSTFDCMKLQRLVETLKDNVKTYTAATINELSDKLDTCEFDVIIIDYMLAGAIGLDAMPKIKEHPQNSGAAIIMITGRSDLDIVQSALASGCDDILYKEGLSAERLRLALFDSVGRSISRRISQKRILADAKAEELKAIIYTYQNIMNPTLLKMKHRIQLLRNASVHRQQCTETHEELEVYCNQLLRLLEDMSEIESEIKLELHS